MTWHYDVTLNSQMPPVIYNVKIYILLRVICLIRILNENITRSSGEAEYRGVDNAVAETCSLRNLLRELHTPLSSAMLVYYDNVIVLHVHSRYLNVDIFTKGLPSVLFEEFRIGLSVRCFHAQTAGEC
ncbi:ribonuclease H-like domain-containing protein [Tanacetum coccineum]|uniref:Ribonuclease H-like domain-containing protein n=1 Tax=Tanacetum coccineum TaxID=301880 RepID=A0ABQ5DUV6_9ASTR